MHIPNIDNSYCNSASAEYNISFLRSSIMSYISSNFVWTSTTLENSKCSWDACRMCRCGRRIHLSLFGVYTLCAVLSSLLVSCWLLFIYTDQYLSILCYVANMAEKVGWPNVKDQYELLDVIGLYWTSTLESIFISFLGPEVFQFVCDVVKDTGKEDYLRPFVRNW